MRYELIENPYQGTDTESIVLDILSVSELDICDFVIWDYKLNKVYLNGKSKGYWDDDYDDKSKKYGIELVKKLNEKEFNKKFKKYL